MKINKEVLARFFDKIDKSGDCWNWTGCKSSKGYGRFMFNGKVNLVHRFSWKIYNGEIPLGMMICHKCDNPSCVRVDHLFLGNNSDNQRDAVQKNRHWNVKKTICKNGHPFIEENTYYRCNGNRICKECAKKSTAETYRRSLL